MLNTLQSVIITRFHDHRLDSPDWPLIPVPELRPGLWGWLEINHRYNTLLWDEENRARRPDASDRDIAASKRRIDRYQKKHSASIEAMDEIILGELDEAPHGARLNSESAGAIIDRLSCLALRIHHMREQVRRAAAGSDHIVNCNLKLRQLVVQRRELAYCFDELINDARQGRACFRVYRQFRMHDDSLLNPSTGWQAGAAQRAS